MIDQTQKLAVKVARLYYLQNLTQEEIAQKLGISRSKVSRLLSWARENGIVKISVAPAPCADLEEALSNIYGGEFLVVEPEDVTLEGILESIATAASTVLIEKIRSGMTIGVSWGRTLAKLAQVMPTTRKLDVQIVQLVGGLGHPGKDSHAVNVIVELARRLQARPIVLPAPGIVKKVAEKALLMSDPYIKQAFQTFERLDLAIVGIGAPSSNSILLQEGTILSIDDLELLRMNGAVGDIVLRFFDRKGEPVKCDLDDRVVGITLDQLREVEEVIAIAGGREKVEAIRAALKTGLVKTLVTDSFTAEQLVKDEGVNLDKGNRQREHNK